MTRYEIYFRPEAENDLNHLGGNIQKRILKAIRQRLGENPELYGKALGGKLTGLRRVRIGDYRLAYQIETPRVIVWAIKHRREIYKELEQRYR